jgi:hypothetical protein
MVNKISLVALALLLSGCSVEDAAGPDVVNGELPESKYQAFLNGQEENGDDDNFPANGQFPSEWLTLQGSASGWQVTQDRTFAGDYALKSGSVGNGQYSAMVLTDTFEAGTFSFFYYISSEFEQDGLIVQVDGESVLVDSGVKSQWFEFTMELEAGQHEILFAYTKNNSNADGEDAAWIDNVNLPERSTSNGSADVFPEGGDVFPTGWSMASGVNANWQVLDVRSY